MTWVLSALQLALSLCYNKLACIYLSLIKACDICHGRQRWEIHGPNLSNNILSGASLGDLPFNWAPIVTLKIKTRFSTSSAQVPAGSNLDHSSGG